MESNRDMPMSDQTRSAGQEDLAPTRRDMVRRGVRLVFVAPVLSTILASDVYAAASRFSCYPTGHVCSAASQENCCNGACPGNPGVCP
jgi:hypothetical protein